MGGALTYNCTFSFLIYKYNKGIYGKTVRINIRMDIFNNRELANFIWFASIILFFLCYREIGKTMVSIFEPKLIGYFICMIIYIGLIIYILYLVGNWNIRMIKDSIMWFLFSAIPFMFYICISEKPNRLSCKNLLLNSLNWTIFLIFIVNFYSFSFAFEVCLVPFWIIVSCFYSYFCCKNSHSGFRKLLNGIILVIGISELIYSCYHVFIDPDRLINIHTLKIFLLPVILMVFLYPFIYLILCFDTYYILILASDKRNGKIKNIKTFLSLLLHPKLVMNDSKINVVNNEKNGAEIRKYYEIQNNK